MIKGAAILKDGVMYTGKNHAEIFQKTLPLGCLRNGYQGFVTTDGMFVNRIDALLIAKANNQIITKHGSPQELYSEDLYM
jgi:hypothetical protein